MRMHFLAVALLAFASSASAFPLIDTAGSAAKRDNWQGTTTFTGRIEVRKADGEVVGNLWSAFGVGVDNINHINHIGPDDDLLVSFTTTSDQVPSGPLNIRATNKDNEQFPISPFLGIRDFDSSGITPVSTNTLDFTVVQEKPPGVPPTNGEESAIWYYYPVPRQITAQFTNPTAVTPAEPQTIFMLHPPLQKIFVVGNVETWNAANPGVGAIEVTINERRFAVGTQVSIGPGRDGFMN